jgi:uncharacterized protein YcbX
LGSVRADPQRRIEELTLLRDAGCRALSISRERPLARGRANRDEPGEFFPGGRLYAIENGPSGFDPAAPVHQPKIKFLMLAGNARLAALTTRYDAATTVLSIEQGGIEVVAGALATNEGRAAVERFFDAFCADEMRGPALVLAAPRGFRFTDSRAGFVSLINVASVRAIAEKARAQPRSLALSRQRLRQRPFALAGIRAHRLYAARGFVGP